MQRIMLATDFSDVGPFCGGLCCWPRRMGRCWTSCMW